MIKLISLLYDEDTIDILDFESSAGTLSNLITITGYTFDVGPYGLEFSSDSSKFYVSDGAGENITQFDLTYTSATDIINYAIEVASVSGASLGALQMGPDEKIYVADKDKNYLHVIHRPDGLGVQCNFQENDFSLTSSTVTGVTSQWGLPNIITTKSLSCDRYMYISDKLYEYDQETKEFGASILNINILHNDLSADTTSNVTIPIVEGEFILKNYYNFPVLTLISNQLDINRSSFPSYQRGSEYGLYDPRTDSYFLNMFKADIPILSTISTVNIGNINNLTVKSRFTDGVTSRFYLGSTNPITDPLVSLNGSVLAKDIEYSASTGATQYIQLSFIPLIDQIITIAYVENGNNGNLYTDFHEITSPIHSGPINDQSPTDKVYFNTTTNRSEFYMDMPSTNIPILVVNGNVLSYGIDYLLSSSNNKRIIILDVGGTPLLVLGDLIELFYVPSTTIYGDLESNNTTLSWYINNAPTLGFGGKFTVEFVSELDTDFDTILYSIIVDSIVDQPSYSTIINLSGASAGDNFRYRVKYKKTYTSISGKILTSESESEAYLVSIITNIGDEY